VKVPLVAFEPVELLLGVVVPLEELLLGVTVPSPQVEVVYTCLDGLYDWQFEIAAEQVEITEPYSPVGSVAILTQPVSHLQYPVHSTLTLEEVVFLLELLGVVVVPPLQVEFEYTCFEGLYDWQFEIAAEQVEITEPYSPVGSVAILTQPFSHKQ